MLFLCLCRGFRVFAEHFTGLRPGPGGEHQPAGVLLLSRRWDSKNPKNYLRPTLIRLYNLLAFLEELIPLS
jgi:hypothetical protein